MKKLNAVFAFLAIAALLLAQQPVQLQTYNGGGAVALGHGTAATALRVELPTDGTGIVGLATGANVVGAVTQSGTWTVQPGNTANTTAWLTTMAPSTASAQALSRFHNSSAAGVNVKASAGNLYGLVLGNSGTVPCWLQVMNTAGTPTAGTSVVDSYMVQAGVTITVPPGTFALTNYSTGIGVAGATTDGGATTTGCTTTFSVTVYYN